MKTGTESTQTQPQLTNLAPDNFNIIISDIPADTLWINMVAQCLGINTLLSRTDENITPEKMWEIIHRMDGAVLSHPVLAKAIIFNYVTKTFPSVYSTNVNAEFGTTEKAYLFKGWGWDNSNELPVISLWFRQSAPYCANFVLPDYKKIYDSMMDRCLTTHIRDIFLHFGKTRQYGVFLSRMYDAMDIPEKILKSHEESPL